MQNNIVLSFLISMIIWELRWDFKDGDGSFGGSKRTNGNVGNGGFSWRSKKLMNLVQSYCKYEIVNAELVTVVIIITMGFLKKFM